MPIISWLSGLDFGFGYDMVRGEPKQRGVQGSGAPPIEASGQEGDVSFMLVKNSEEFDNALSIDSKVNVGIGMFGGSAKFNFRKMCKASTQATFCVLRVSATNAYEQIPDPKLTEEAWNLLSTGDTGRFRQRFGDAFVSGRYVGIEFYGVIRVEARSAERQLEIASEIQAKYGTFVDGGGKVKIDQRTKSSEHRIEVFTFQRGGSIQVCQTLDDLTALARHALDEGRSGRGYPHAVMLDPYEELKLPQDAASPIQVEAARRAIGRLLAHRDALERLQNDIDFVLRNQEWFVSPAVPALNQASRAISSEIDTLVERADVCSRDFGRCENYQPKYPDLVLPLRKVDSGQGGVTEGDVIMSPDDPTVFLVENRTKRWVPDEPTYLSRWTWDQLKIVPAAVVNAIARGPDLRSILAPLPSGVTEGDVVRSPEVPAVFLIEAGTRRWVPDEPTYLSRWTWDQLKVVPAEVVNGITRGLDLPSVA